MSVNWLLLSLSALFLDLIVFEPLVCLFCAVVSSQLWTKPVIINECINRFKVVLQDINLRSWMFELGWISRPLTFFIHKQAAPQSASLFHLHHIIFDALKSVVRLPDVVFQTGVYWLIIYTTCTLILVNLQSDMYQSNSQGAFTRNMLGLHKEPRPISVEKMWDFLENRLRPELLDMEANVNLTLETGEIQNTTHSVMGGMLISPIRVKQIRLKPFDGRYQYKDKRCSPVPSARIGREQQCNFEFTRDTMETRSFVDSWNFPIRGQNPGHFAYSPDGSTLFEALDFLPLSGFKQVLFLDDGLFQQSLSLIKDSSWIDQHTRFIVIDFSVINMYSSIVSCFHITFDFNRPAPYWYTVSFHFFHSLTGNTFYYMAITMLVFLMISANNILKELLLVYKSGPLDYFSNFSSYVEIIKVLLSTILCYVHFRKVALKSFLLQELKYSYLEKENSGFVDFLEMAVMDYAYTFVGGVLGFLCFFQILNMLSKIRRLVVFMRLVIMAVKLFYMPMLAGLAFTFLSNILFSSTNENFSGFWLSYLMVNQYFIKPRAIYRELTDNHPFIGPLFYFLMGMMISLFFLNFFIAFLNEAYSSIHNQVRIESYKIREKTKMEYVYEFLGIESKITYDPQDDLRRKEREMDKDFMVELKRLKCD